MPFQPKPGFLLDGIPYIYIYMVVSVRKKERESENAGIKVKGNLFAVFSYCNCLRCYCNVRHREDEVSLISEDDSNHLSAHTYKIQQGKPQQILGKILGSQLSQSNTGRGCPEKLRTLHL